jgi:hypothetical protein
MLYATESTPNALTSAGVLMNNPPTEQEESSMAFVNERISKEDFEKYGLQKINSAASSWTIDRDNDIWLSWIRNSGDPREPGEDRSKSYWNFYWKGHLIRFWVKLADVKVDWALWRLLSLEIPQTANPHRTQILKDIESAFLAYKDGGIYAESTDFSITFEIPEKLKD